jgi:preprotein translocase subunit SecD
MTQTRTGLILSGALWLGVTLYGIYFMKQVVMPAKDERGYINFGIDLVGGTYLTLDVKVQEAIKNDLMEVMQSFVDALKKERKPVPASPVLDEKTLQGTLSFDSAADASAALSLYRHDVALPKVTQNGKDLQFAFSSNQLGDIQRDAVESNIAILRTRLDAFGAGEVGIVPQGERRIGIELPNVSDPEKAKARVGKAAILELKPVFDTARTEDDLINRSGGSIPEGTVIVPGRTVSDGFYLVPKYAKITGKQLKSASYQFAQEGFSTKSPHAVGFEFKGEGVTRFGDMTNDNLGKMIAIILDNVVISSPVVNVPIESGSGLITGNFSREEADELVSFLKSGAFSAPVEVIEERHIGPSLGAESIRKGLISCAIALLLLLIFSLFVYKVAGLFAFLVLLYNLLFIMFGLALVPEATLTLPGIAGMVLTIGMAIDSSILIYERMKEELYGGSSLRKAVDSGFGGALSVILDANITTFIVGAVLYYLGSPAIQGFALTMMIGIVATLLTGLVLLKTVFNLYIASGATSIKI